MSGRAETIDALRRKRPRSRFARASGLLLFGLMIYAWIGGDFHVEDLFSARRRANLHRFLGELKPHPLQGRDFDWGVAANWAGEILEEKGWAAAGATLAISVGAILLAALGGLLASLPAARTIATPEPFLPGPSPPHVLPRLFWRCVVVLTRFVLIFLRAIPEYVWAFLFFAMLPPTYWPAVIALGFHNAGILGKLTAETIENARPGPLAALRGLGAGRLQIAATGVFPAILPRFLLYFFYRWETCVREATVIGMLGALSLGSVIKDAQAGFRYDEMLLFVLLGAAIVLLGDLVSAVARGFVRRAA